MIIVRDTLEIVEIGDGFALYGLSLEGETIFVAHLGDGVDGLPEATDPDLPEAYGFTLSESEEMPSLLSEPF